MYFFQVLEFDSVSGLIANPVPQEGAVLQCDFMPSAWCGIDRVISPPNFQTQYSGRVVPSQHCECCIRDFIFAPLLFKESGACISWLSSAHSFFFFWKTSFSSMHFVIFRRLQMEMLKPKSCAFIAAGKSQARSSCLLTNIKVSSLQLKFKLKLLS